MKDRDAAAYARTTALHGKWIATVSDSDGVKEIENLDGFIEIRAEDSEGYWVEGRAKQNWSDNRSIRIDPGDSDWFLAGPRQSSVTIKAASGGKVRIIYRGPRE